MRCMVFRGLATFLAIVGMVCVAFPFFELFVPGGSMLPLDTRAYFGAGTAESVPPVSAVNCSARAYGTSVRGKPSRTWQCYLTLGNVPFPRRHSTLSIPDIDVQSGPSFLERELPFERSGELPTLRRMSGDGKPLEYGVIWGGRELASRWSMWALTALLMCAFGGAAICAARVAWHRR